MKLKTPLSKMTMSFKLFGTFTFFLAILVSTLPVKAQFFDRLSNPTISINLAHPPGLGLKINKIAFGRSFGECSDQITDALISDFVGNQIEVINRSSLESILAKRNLRLKGYIDRGSAAEIGKIIGPCALVLVKVQRCAVQQDRVTEKEKRRDPKTKQDNITTAYFSRTRAFLKASIQTVDLATGRIFAAQVFDYSPEKSNKSYQGYPEAPAKFDVQDIAFRMLVSDVHRMYLPWNEMTTVNFYDDKDCGLKLAYQALKVGDIDQAFTLSQQSVENCKQTGAKNKLLGQAYYNLGMCYMLRNEHDMALQNFREAEKFRPGGILNEAIAKCLKARDLMSAMQQIEDRASYEADKSQMEEEKAAEQESANLLTNADILVMTKNKIPKSIIIQKIKNSKCKFDTSPNALSNLNKSGVNEEVIMLMMK